MSDPLTNAGDVRAVSGTVLLDDILTGMIADAHLMVSAALVGSTVDEDTQAAIEKYVAAYFAWGRDETLRITTDHQGQASVSLQERSFLDMAYALDPTGKLKGKLEPSGFKPIFRAAQTTRGDS